MSNTIESLRAYMSEAGYSTGVMNTPVGDVTIFENESVLGFVLLYPNAAALVEDWKRESDLVLQAAQFPLRQAGTKAWNVYLILLAETPGSYGENTSLGGIEENLVGTRKIARSGVSNQEELRAALLPLFPIQNAPRLEVVDMKEEIRLRTSELPEDLVDAFLSDAPEATLIQLLESGQ